MADLFNLEVEEMFLGVLARLGRINPGKAKILLEQSLVTADRLYDAAHRAILQAITELVRDGQTVDSRTLWAKLKDSAPVGAKGGLRALVALLDSGDGHEAALPTYATNIREMALRRRMVELGRELAAKAGDLALPAADTLSESTRLLSSITLTKRELRTLEDYLSDCVDEMEAVNEGKVEPVIPTGLGHLDALIGGLQPTLIVIGAMPGVGKSALFATLTHNLARAGHKVGIFSLEDEGRWIAWRLLSHESGVQQFVLRNRKLTNSQRNKTVEGYTRIAAYARNVVVDDRSALSPQEIVQTARDMILNRGCKAIFVDHAGEIRYANKHKDRYDLELTEGLSDLREISKRYRVPVVVAAHLKRRPGLDPGAEPQLTDFANSSAFERQARLALGLSRENGSDTLRVTVLKQTNGATGIKAPDGSTINGVDLRFVGMAAMVADCEREAIRDWYAEQPNGDPSDS